MEALGEPESEVAAVVGEPLGPAGEGFGVAAFGHEDDAVGGEGETGLEGLDFLQVGVLGDHEFEDGLGGAGEELEGTVLDAELLGIAGIGELG